MTSTVDPGLRRLAVELRSTPTDTRSAWLKDVSAKEPESLAAIWEGATREFGTKYGIWADDPVGFVHDVCDEATTARQREILLSVRDNPRTAVPSAFSTGKCAWEHDELALADGSVHTFGSLVGSTFALHSWAPDGSVQVRRARAEWNAVESVYRLVTSAGRTVVRNAEHPLWAAQRTKLRSRVIPEVRGWTPLSSLAPGDLVLVPERHPSEGAAPRSFDTLALVGYLLGDGGTTADVRFSQQPGPALDEFAALVERAGCRLVKLSRPVDYAVRGKAWRSNPVLDLVREAGLWGKKARDKRFPAWAWTLPNADLAVLVSRLFACDAWATSSTTPDGGRRAQVGIALASEGLVRDVERAMLRLGVPGRVRFRTATAGGKTFPAWEWSCTDVDDLLTLSKVLAIPGKQDAVDAAVELLAGRPGARGTRTWRSRNCPPGYRWDVVRTVERLPGLHRTVAVEVEGESTFLTSLVEHNTHIMARLKAWWVCVHPVGTAKVITTASRMSQLRTQLWQQTRKLHASAKLPGNCQVTQWVMPRLDGGLELVSWGYTPPRGEPESVQGEHAANVLVEIDESGLIHPLTGAAWLSATTGLHTRILACGNPPIDEEGSWLENITHSSEWVALPIAAKDTPNFTGEDVGRCRSCMDWQIRPHPVRDHLISPADVEAFVREYGEDSAFVEAKVHARFVKGAANKAIPSLWVERARVERSELIEGLSPAREAELRGPQPRISLGVDTAQGGADELVVARAEGNLARIVRHQRGEANANSFDVAGFVKADIEEAQKLRRQLGSRDKLYVSIDASGDRGPADTLVAWNSEGLLGPDVVILAVNFGEGAEDRSRYANRRAEMWWSFRKLCQPGDNNSDPELHLLIDDVATGQLADPKHHTNPSGKIVLESKDDLRDRGRPSPDRADALCLSRYWPASLIPRKRRGIIVG